MNLQSLIKHNDCVNNTSPTSNKTLKTKIPKTCTKNISTTSNNKTLKSTPPKVIQNEKKQRQKRNSKSECTIPTTSRSNDSIVHTQTIPDKDNFKMNTCNADLENTSLIDNSESISDFDAYVKDMFTPDYYVHNNDLANSHYIL